MFSAGIAVAADEKPTERPSAWEKLCLDGAASAACDKASSILSEKLVETEDQSGDQSVNQSGNLANETTLRERLIKVSRKGCDSGHLPSCAELISADDAKENQELAIGVAKKNCLLRPDPTSTSCKYMSQWQTGDVDFLQDSKPRDPKQDAPPKLPPEQTRRESKLGPAPGFPAATDSSSAR